MKTLYNEGRVVGLSQYELYVKTMLSRNPSASILSESQWLAASLSTNNSMILKIKSGTSAGYHDYMLPEGSDLCGCTCMFATVFEGNVITDENDLWAIGVDDYGRLISNGGRLHPVTPGMPEDVPVKDNYREEPELFARQSREYMKLSTGLVLQPGSWTDNVFYEPLLTESGQNIWTEDGQDLLVPLSNDIAKMTLHADLSKRGFIRLLFDESIDLDFYIFFHGFSYKNILAGMSGFDDLLNTHNPENGDFLGPQSFPWAVHIVFLYTNDMLSTIKQSVSNMEDLYEQVVEQTTYYEEIARELNDRYAILSDRYAQLTERFTQLTDDFEALQSQFGYFFTEDDITITNILDRIAVVDDRVTTTNDRITEEETNIDAISSGMLRLDMDMDNIIGRMDTVQIRVDDFGDILDTTADELNTRIDSVDSKIGDLNALTPDETVESKKYTSIVEAIGSMNDLADTIKTPPTKPDIIQTIDKVYSLCKNT